jgi:hypothetical protein
MAWRWSAGTSLAGSDPRRADRVPIRARRGVPGPHRRSASGSGWLVTGPVMSDWDRDGLDTVGVFRDGIWYQRNANSSGPSSTFRFGLAGDRPVSGGDQDRDDTPGVVRNGVWYYRNSLGPSVVRSFSFGLAGDLPAVWSRSRCSPAYPGVCIHLRPRIWTAATSRPGISGCGRPTRTALTAMATASAAKPDQTSTIVQPGCLCPTLLNRSEQKRGQSSPHSCRADAADGCLSGQNRWCGPVGPGWPCRSPGRSSRRCHRPGRWCRPGYQAAAPQKR